MIGMKLRREKLCRPTASPTTRPIATDSAKATASSNKVICSAAGTPRVPNILPSAATTREGGARKSGSTTHHADAEPRQAGAASDTGGERGHQYLRPRASKVDTTTLRNAAIATTKAM